MCAYGSSQLTVDQSLGWKLYYPPIMENQMKIWKMRWKLGERRDLRNLIEVAILGKPYELLHIPIMAT